MIRGRGCLRVLKFGDGDAAALLSLERAALRWRLCAALAGAVAAGLGAAAAAAAPERCGSGSGGRVVVDGAAAAESRAVCEPMDAR